MNIREAGIKTIQGVTAAVVLDAGVVPVGVERLQSPHQTPNPHVRSSSEGLPSSNAVVINKDGQPVFFTFEKRKTESGVIHERALEPGSNFVADHMQVSADGNVTAALIMDRDGKYHLAVAGTDVTFTDKKELPFVVYSLAMDPNDPNRMAVAGQPELGVNIGILYYTEDRGQTWTELRADTMDQATKEATGGLKGAIGWVGYNPNGGLEFTELSENPRVDKNLYAGILPKGERKITHRVVETEPGLQLAEPLRDFYTLTKLQKTKNAGVHRAAAVLQPTGHVGVIESTKDRFVIRNESPYTPNITAMFTDAQGNNITWSAINLMPGRTPNPPDSTVSQVMIMENNQFLPEKSFQIPYALFPPNVALSISALVKDPDEDTIWAAVAVLKRDNRAFTQILKIANASKNPGTDSKNFSIYTIIGEWPTEGVVNSLGGFTIFKTDEGKVMRMAFITTRDGQNGKVVDVKDGVAAQTGYIGPRPTQRPPGELKNVWLATVAKNRVSSSGGR